MPLLTSIVGGLIVVREPVLEDDERQLVGFGQRRLLHCPKLQPAVDTREPLGLFSLRNAHPLVHAFDAYTTTICKTGRAQADHRTTGIVGSNGIGKYQKNKHQSRVGPIMMPCWEFGRRLVDGLV